MPEGDAPAWSERDADFLTRVLVQEDRGYASVFMDAQGVITGWSVAAMSITGWTAGEAVGQPMSLIFTPEDRQRALDAHELRAARETGQSEDERWHVRKDGARFWASGITMWAGAATPGFLKVFKDATHLRARARAVENQLQAERLNRQAQFATVAHELRGPLAPLRSAFEVLSHDPSPAVRDRVAPLVLRQLDLLERQVEDLVDLTRARAGKLRLKIEQVDLVDLVSSAVASCETVAQARQVGLRAILPPGPLLVDLDVIRMTQVVTNLVGNAVKFSPPGKDVDVLATLSGAHFLIQVRDQGVGIAADLLPRIFEMFTQGETGDTVRGAGLGVGLAVVKEIVSLHGGSVEVRSDGLGKGSEFFVHAPVHHPPAAGSGTL